MNLQKQTKFICQFYNIWPQKTKGQNFLINPKILETIIKIADIKKNETILEVGPGLGILTERLIKLACQVIAIELDKKIFDFLKNKFFRVKNLKLINADILKFKITNFKDYKIVANLPYNITSPFLEKFLTQTPRPAEMILMVQKEVAKRICASAGQLSRLSVLVQFYSQPKVITNISKNNFWPQPEVDSSIIKVVSCPLFQNKLFPLTEKQFFRIVKIGFSSKRKQLQNNLAASLKISNLKVKDVLKSLQLNPLIRAQELSVDNWLVLAKKLKNHLN